MLLARGGPATEWGLPLRPVAWAESDAEGRFRFAPVEPVADAEIAVATESGASSATAARGLDLTHDRDDLVLFVDRHVPYVVRATYPDGAAVARSDMALLFEDATGAWRSSWHQDAAGYVFPAVPGRRHRVVVHAGQGDSSGALFRGEATLSPATGSNDVAVVSVHRMPPVPPAPPHEGSTGIDAAEHGQRTYLLRFVDDRDGSPIGNRLLQISAKGGGGAGRLSADGRRLLRLGLGRRWLRLYVEGYEPEDVLVEPREHGHESVELRLRRAR
jgi:hypothetical protein